MRVEWHDSDDIEDAGQFIIFAESEIESGMIKRFIAMQKRKDWKFWLHGGCYSCDLRRYTSFNFGFIKYKEQWDANRYRAS